ncbi:MAG: YkgJ family cysteine cluster protein [Desulfocucumaceae bacterium]
MLRLPLNYPSIFLSWQALSGKLYNPGSPYQAWVSVPVWSEKLSFLNKIITCHPDISPCMRCGECCLDFPFACRPVEFLYLLPYMATQWSYEQQKAFFDERLGILGGDGRNRCPFLVPGGCSIYPVRPLICRKAICGDHICNRLSRDFENTGHWCGDMAVVTQLTVMNLAYYDFSGSQPEEMGWPAPSDSGLVPEMKNLSVAPFEIWLLILLGENYYWEGINGNAFYRPLLRFVGGQGNNPLLDN